MAALLLIFVVLISGNSVRAEAGKISSMSYENLIRCFPELIHQDISAKVDLGRLKEIVDDRFVTSRSQIELRKARFKDFDGNEMNFEVRYEVVNLKKTNSYLKVQKMDRNGIWNDVSLPDAQRLNPKQEFIDSFLLGSKVESDEFYYNDTKLQAVRAVYRKNFKEIVEYSLTDTQKKRSVRCEKKEDLGILCLCSRSAK